MATWPSAGTAWRAGVYVLFRRIVRRRPANSRRPTSRSLPVSWSSCPNPFTTRTPLTAPSTTPATAAAWAWAYQVAGWSLLRLRLAIPPRAGATARATRVSGSESHAMITREITNSRMFPMVIGSMKSKPWMSWRSLVARPTTCPVDSSSWRRPSSRVIVPYISVRRSCWTSRASRPP